MDLLLDGIIKSFELGGVLCSRHQICIRKARQHLGTGIVPLSRSQSGREPRAIPSTLRGTSLMTLLGWTDSKYSMYDGKLLHAMHALVGCGVDEIAARIIECIEQLEVRLFVCRSHSVRTPLVTDRHGTEAQWGHAHTCERRKDAVSPKWCRGRGAHVPDRVFFDTFGCRHV